MNENLPESGKFKIAVVGPVKNGTSKKTGKAYKTYDIQFEGDPRWYNTFWTKDEDPKPGDELEGEKSYNGDFDNYQFKTRGGGRGGFNPAAAQAQVMVATATMLNGFLAAFPEHKEAFASGEDAWKAPFKRYMEAVISASSVVKDGVVNMGALNAEARPAPQSAQAPTVQPGPITDVMNDALAGEVPFN